MASEITYSHDLRADSNNDIPVNDIAVHEDSFRNFVAIAYVATLHVANFLLALAIGALQHHWITAVFIMAAATILSVYSLMTRAKAPLAALTVFSFLALWVGSSS